MENINKSQTQPTRVPSSTEVTGSGQPPVSNPNNRFPQEGIGSLSDHQGKITHLSDYLPGSTRHKKHNETIRNSWQQIIENEDFEKLDELINKINSLDSQNKEIYIYDLCSNVDVHGSLEVYSYVLENLQDAKSVLRLPAHGNPHFVPIMSWMHANSLLSIKDSQSGFYNMCQSMRAKPLSVTPEWIDKCKLMLYVGCTIKPEGEEFTPYNRIAQGITDLGRKPDSEEKTKALAVLNEIKNIFDQVEALDKQGIPREEMEILEIPGLSSSRRIKSASSYGKIVE